MPGSPESKELASVSTTPLLETDRVSNWQALKTVAASALPFAVQDAILISAGFINSAFLKESNGEEGLAALALANPIVNFTYGFTISALYSVSINIGQADERKQAAKVGIIYRQGMIFAILLSLPAMGILLLSGPALRALKQPEDAVKLAEEFLQGFATGYMPALGYVTQQQLALGLKLPSALVGAAVINTGLIALFDYLFTLDEVNFPISKAFALGCANSLANAATFIIFTLYLKRKEFNQYFLFANHWVKNELIKLRKMGLPMGVQVAAELASLVGLSVMVGQQENGVTALAAEQVSLLYLYILSIPTQISIATAAGVEVAREFAAMRFANSRRYGNIALALSVGISGICLIVVVGFNKSKYLITPFVDDPDNQALISQASDLLILNTATQILDAFRNITGGSLRGYNNFTAATVWGILGNTVVALPLAYVLGFYTSWGSLGMFAARTFGIGLASSAMTYLWNKVSSNAETLPRPAEAKVEEITDEEESETEADSKAEGEPAPLPAAPPSSPSPNKVESIQALAEQEQPPPLRKSRCGCEWFTSLFWKSAPPAAVSKPAAPAAIPSSAPAANSSQQLLHHPA